MALAFLPWFRDIEFVESGCGCQQPVWRSVRTLCADLNVSAISAHLDSFDECIEETLSASARFETGLKTFLHVLLFEFLHGHLALALSHFEFLC